MDCPWGDLRPSRFWRCCRSRGLSGRRGRPARPRGVLGAYGRALSGFGGGWSEQPSVSCFGAFVGHQTIDRSRVGMWATVPRQCCRPIGRSCDGEPRDVAPAAGSDAPTRCGSPSALSSGCRSTIRTSDPDRLRPAGSLNRGQPRHAATRKRSGSRSSAQRPTHGARSDTRPDVAGALDQVLGAPR